MVISCTALVEDKRRQKKLIESLNDCGVTPEVHAKTVIAEWENDDKVKGKEMLERMSNLFEPYSQHSIYYSTMP